MLTSSYPAKRPNTDWRNNPVNRCRVFLPRRRSDQRCARQFGQPKHIVQFAVGQQSSVGGDTTAAEFEPQPTVEIKPQEAVIRFTGRVFHDCVLRSPTTR